MRRLVLIAPLLTLAGFGLDDRLEAYAAGWQRNFQTALAGSLRALRAWQTRAPVVMLGICFAYGFFHAVGPGHGRFLVGGYGLDRQVPFARLAMVSLISSLGQAASVIGLVAAGLLVLGWSKT